MTKLTMNRDMPVRQHSRAGSNAVRREGSPLTMGWRWLVAISQIAVEYRYAAPWDSNADRRQGTEAKARR